MSVRRVAYCYDPEVGNFYYGQGHPMKPHRIRMTHSLLVNYGLYKKLEIFRPHRATAEEMTMFHSDDYIDFLSKITPDNMGEYVKQLQMFNVGEDCPVYDGIFEYAQVSAGGSIDAAVRLNRGDCDVAINWAGGLHHAKKSEASGFCYVNDIVLAVLELLKYHHRVLYIDIDVHHGDGVEEAFYTTDRVMTLSFHKHGDYFPGTGDINDVGSGRGKYCALNFPLHDGLDDEGFMSVFEPIVKEILAVYQPGAIVLQSGADSLSGDRLGCFNLSLRGHSFAIDFCKKLGLPVLLLGGGGYTIRNVARCWTYETARCVDAQLPDHLPFNDYIDYYGPDYRLQIECNNMENLNTREYMQHQLQKLLQHLKHVAPPGMAPGPRPPDHAALDSDSDGEDKNVRVTTRMRNKRIARDHDFSDSEDEDDRRNISVFEHAHAQARAPRLAGEERRSGPRGPPPPPDVPVAEDYASVPLPPYHPTPRGGLIVTSALLHQDSRERDSDAAMSGALRGAFDGANGGRAADEMSTPLTATLAPEDPTLPMSSSAADGGRAGQERLLEANVDPTVPPGGGGGSGEGLME